MLIPHGSLILVADGSGLRLLRNQGRDDAASLALVQEHVLHAASRHAHVESRPGRSFESAGPDRHAYEAVDKHRQSEADFAREAMELLQERLPPDGTAILIAPPRLLGEMRPYWKPHCGGRILLEVDKDLMHYMPAEIEAFLVSYR